MWGTRACTSRSINSARNASGHSPSSKAVNSSSGPIGREIASLARSVSSTSSTRLSTVCSSDSWTIRVVPCHEWTTLSAVRSWASITRLSSDHSWNS